MFYNEKSRTIHIRDVTYKGQQFKPEKNMRDIHICCKDFFKFHKMLVEFLELYDEQQTFLTKTFTVIGGWGIPKLPLLLCDLSIFNLGQYARWFWDLSGGYVLVASFTQNKLSHDLLLSETDTHYNGFCTMDVILRIQTLNNDLNIF